MSQYLSNIAARSSGNNSNELLPSKPVFKGEDNGIGQELTEQNNIQDNIFQNEFVQQRVVTAEPTEPITPQKVQQPVILNETGSGLTPKNTETSYFTSHIERMEVEKENSTVKNTVAETMNFKIAGTTQNTVVEDAAGKPNTVEPVLVNKQTSIIEPLKKITKKQVAGKANEKVNEKTAEINVSKPVDADEMTHAEKQVIQPLNKAAEVQNKKINSPQHLERIIPNQRDQLNEKPVHNSKKKEAAPKLVIGKIIVEILSPKLPVPQKVITRVVQSPSKDSYSKSNKLIFGLRQL